MSTDGDEEMTSPPEVTTGPGVGVTYSSLDVLGVDAPSAPGAVSLASAPEALLRFDLGEVVATRIPASIFARSYGWSASTPTASSPGANMAPDAMSSTCEDDTR